MSTKKSILKKITFLFFVIFIIEICLEYIAYKPLLLIFKPLIPLILIILYLIESDCKSKIYVFAMFLSLLTNLLFIPRSSESLLYALMVFTVHRILIIYLIAKLNKVSDYISIIIATLPFIIVFSYLYYETPFLSKESAILIILQNVLISVFAGISLSGYVMNDNKRNSILLISALLFVMLQFSVFIEKYFLNYEYSEILRPLSMTLNGMAFYSFYRYVIEAEKLNED